MSDEIPKKVLHERAYQSDVVRNVEDNIAAVAKCVTKHPQPTQRIVDQVKFGRTTVHSYLNELIKRGVVVKVRVRGTNGYYWKLK